MRASQQLDNQAELDDTVERDEKYYSQKRIAKVHHKFVCFGREDAKYQGSMCPFCTNISNDPWPAPAPAGEATRQQHILQQAEFTRFSKLIDMLHTKGHLKNQSTKVQFYGDNQIIMHNQRMMKKLLKQEIVK